MTLLIEGGRVLRPDLSVERADVRIDDGGTIDAVGDVERDGEARTLDAAGCLVLPGLVNAHCHAAMALLRGYADDEPLETWLREAIWPVEAELGPADVAAGVRLGALEMIRSGTTTVGDMYFHVGAVVDAVAEAGLRARVGHGVVTVGKDEDAARADFRESLRAAREYDGAADGRVTTAVMPHSLTTVGAEFFEEFVPEARDAGVPVHFHANETRGEVDPIVEEHGQRPLAYADDLGLLTGDTWIAHGVHLDAAERDLLAERDVAVVHCPASNAKLASGMAPVQDLLDKGVTVGLGTDGPASNNDLDLFDEMRDAATMGKLAADDASAVPAAAVVEMATRGGADALGLPVGRLEPGAPGDVAVVDLEAAHLTPEHDLVSLLAYAARGSDVRHTVCDGRVLMRDREVLTLDASSVRAEAEERAKAAVDRA